jgi:hypothetical protein
MAQRPQIAFLHRVFGIGGVAHQIARQREDVVEMRQRGVAKTPRPFAIDIVHTGDGVCSGHYRVSGRPRCRRRLVLQAIEHQGVVLLPVAASTTIVPVMCG